MLTLDQFRGKFGEFFRSEEDVDTLVQSALDEAELEIDPTVWGVHTDTAHGLLAASKLALSQLGQQARLQSEKGSSTYWTRYVDLRKQVTALLGRV